MGKKSGKTERRERRGPEAGGRGREPAAGDRKAKDVPGAARPSRRWPLMVALVSVGAVLLAAVMIGLNLLSAAFSSSVAVGGAGQGAANPAAGAVPAGAPGAPSGPVAAGFDRRSKGRPDAPVVITEWFDFQCPGCGQYARTRGPEFERLFVDTGKVRFDPRNYAFLGAESLFAAEAAEAAADQGMYWSYYTLLYLRQKGENQGAFSPENLKRFAGELKLDQKAFDDALDRGVHRARVLAEKREGDSLGVKATPTFFINGRMIDGIPTNERMGQLIEEELARKR